MDIFNNYNIGISSLRLHFFESLEQTINQLSRKDHQFKKLERDLLFIMDNPELISPYFMLELSTQQDLIINRIHEKAVKKGMINYFKNSTKKLASCAKESIDNYVDDKDLPSSKIEHLREVSNDVYLVLATEFVELRNIVLSEGDYLDKLISEIPFLTDFLDIGNNLTYSNSQVKIIKSTINQLRKQNYITNKCKSNLLSYLLPKEIINPKKEKVENIKQLSFLINETETGLEDKLEIFINDVPIEGNISSPDKPLSKKLSEEEISYRSEFLIEFFNFPKDLASDYARIISEDESVSVYENLVKVLGEEKTNKLINLNPGIFLYSKENRLNKYLKSLNCVKSSCNGTFEDVPIESYSSLEQVLNLKEKIYSNNNGSDLISDLNNLINPDSSNLNLVKYSFLNKSNPLVKGRLSSLVDKRSLEVNDSEHWSDKCTGARGKQILMKIKHQFGTLYNQLGLNKPRVKIDFNNNRLTISNETRKYLVEIIDKYY